MSDVGPAASGPTDGLASGGDENVSEAAASVRSILPMVRASQFAIRLLWGTDSVLFSNDAHRARSAGNAPSQIEAEYAAQAPLHADNGTVGGVIEMTSAQSQRASADRELATLRQLADAASITELATTRSVLLADLERTRKELDTLNYSVAHDVRAPLRSLDGFSQALLEDHADQLDEKGKDCLRRVCAAAQRIDVLIDDLLSLSRIGRAPLRRQPVDVSQMAEKVAAQLQRQNGNPKVNVEIAGGMIADADLDLVRVVLENLFDNAWKFRARTNEPQIAFGFESHVEGKVYVIRDNGIGFNMTYVERLFAPFQRLHTGSEFPGRGIGLATVRRIVNRHGGRVWAESIVDQGTTIYFTLPPARSATGT